MFEKLKKKLKNYLVKVMNLDIPPEFATINIYQNNKKINTIEGYSENYSRDICKILAYFAKWDKYTILYDYPNRTISIYFTTKKAEEVDTEAQA